MSLRTCRYCKQQYEDTWSNWVSKYCCKDCYRNKKRKFNIGDKIYTYDNKMLPERSGLEAIVATGEIIRIYEVFHPTENGLWHYAIKVPSKDKLINRFEHQIFSDLEECIEFVRLTNERRIILREANKLLKKL